MAIAATLAWASSMALGSLEVNAFSWVHSSWRVRHFSLAFRGPPRRLSTASMSLTFSLSSSVVPATWLPSELSPAAPATARTRRFSSANRNSRTGLMYSMPCDSFSLNVLLSPEATNCRRKRNAMGTTRRSPMRANFREYRSRLRTQMAGWKKMPPRFSELASFWLVETIVGPSGQVAGPGATRAADQLSGRSGE